MNAKLFREEAETRGEDISWSLVGPGHYRAYFGLIPLAGYSAVNRLNDYPYFAPPFKIYGMDGQESDFTIATQPAAKRKVRKAIEQFISTAPTLLDWVENETGVHWKAKANGIPISNYYFCPEPKGNWHKGFKVWFGGTYYVTEFASPDEARSAVAETYNKWLKHAKECLL